MKLLQQIQTIYQLLDDNRIQERGLLTIKDDSLASPIAADMLSLFSYRTSKSDTFRDQAIIENLIAKLKASRNFKGINHIGFCYKVVSKEAEVTRLVGIAKDKNTPVHQEPSIDDGDWLFVGDITDVRNPLLELIPHEGTTNDRWIDYWLPHIQFDIDTDLSPKEIKVIVKGFINDPGVPHAIQIDGITYIQRVHLGCVEGVNIFLDIATNNRDPNYRRQWKSLR